MLNILLLLVVGVAQMERDLVEGVVLEVIVLLYKEKVQEEEDLRSPHL
jgi:hypothetical protein